MFIRVLEASAALLEEPESRQKIDDFLKEHPVLYPSHGTYGEGRKAVPEYPSCGTIGEGKKAVPGGTSSPLRKERFLAQWLLAELMEDSHIQPLPPGNKIRVFRTPEGRPFLPDFPGLCISISHSGNYAAVGIADGKIGLDIQQIRPVMPALSDGRFFPPRDRELLSACKTAAEKESLFFRIWTVREAYLKYTGAGLAGGLDSFEIDFGTGTIFPGKNGSGLSFPENSASSLSLPSACSFCELSPPEPGYRLSIVSGDAQMKPSLSLIRSI